MQELLVLELSEQAQRRQFVLVVKLQRLPKPGKMATGDIGLQFFLENITQADGVRIADAASRKAFYRHVARDIHVIKALERRILDDLLRKLAQREDECSILEAAALHHAPF